MMKLALFECHTDVFVTGRNDDGSPDHCFYKDKEYLFCYDEKKHTVFTVNEVGEFDTSKLEFMGREFTLLRIADVEQFNLDEFTERRLRKLFKERLHYTD